MITTIQENDLIEDDPIVSEMDVYFTDEMLDKLFVFQFPTKKVRTTNNENNNDSENNNNNHQYKSDIFLPDTTPLYARLKPKSMLFEIDVNIDIESPVYDKEKGSEFGVGMGPDPIEEQRRKLIESNNNMNNVPAWQGRGRGSQNIVQDNSYELLNKQTWYSSLLPPHASYMVGIIKNNILNLCPVSELMQIRPSLDYLDRIDKKISEIRVQEKMDSMIGDNEIDTDNEEVGITEEGKVLQMTMRSADDKEYLKESARSEHKKLMEEDKWIKMNICEKFTNESQNLKNIITKPHYEYKVSIGELSASDYITKLNPGLTSFSADPVAPSSVTYKQRLAKSGLAGLPANIGKGTTRFDPINSLTNNRGDVRYSYTKNGDAIIIRKGLTLREIYTLKDIYDQVLAFLLNVSIVSEETIEEILLGEVAFMTNLNFGDLNLDDNPIGIEVPIIERPTKEDLLMALNKYAICIRNQWIIRSELLYSGSALKYRNRLLKLFERKEIVSRKELLPKPKSDDNNENEVSMELDDNIKENKESKEEKGTRKRSTSRSTRPRSTSRSSNSNNNSRKLSIEDESTISEEPIPEDNDGDNSSGNTNRGRNQQQRMRIRSVSFGSDNGDKLADTDFYRLDFALPLAMTHNILGEIALPYKNSQGWALKRI